MPIAFAGTCLRSCEPCTTKRPARTRNETAQPQLVGFAIPMNRDVPLAALVLEGAADGVFGIQRFGEERGDAACGVRVGGEAGNRRHAAGNLARREPLRNPLFTSRDRLTATDRAHSCSGRRAAGTDSYKAAVADSGTCSREEPAARRCCSSADSRASRTAPSRL